MKKVLVIITISMFLLSSIEVMSAENWKIVKSTQNFIINGKPVNTNILNINDSNYVKVTELAEMLDIDIAFDEATNTVSFDKLKPFSGIRIINDTTTKFPQNQIIKIDIERLEPKQYIVLDLCDIQGNDSITFDITSNGKGTIFAGFIEDKDNFSTTYWGNGDFFGEKGKVYSTFSVNGFEGKYYFFVRNNGEELMQDIKGTVTITRAE